MQIVEGKAKDIDRNLIYALVKVGEKTGTDEFYIFTQGVVQDLIYREYTAFLKKHNGVRPRNPDTTHCSYYLRDLTKYKNNWELIINQLA